MDAIEAERAVRSLRPLPLLRVGGTEWFEQHKLYEQLKVASHTAAANHSEDFVAAHLLTWEGISPLVSSLLASHLFNTNVLPLIQGELVAKDAVACPMRAYYIHYHEAVLANLLELLAYHPEIMLGLGDEVLDLIDYAVAQVTRLIGAARPATTATKLDTNTTNSTTSASSATSAAEEAMLQWQRDLRFNIGISCVSILRYITDVIHKIPFSAMSKIINKFDLPLLLVHLIENPPWVRKTTRVVKAPTKPGEAGDVGAAGGIKGAGGQVGKAAEAEGVASEDKAATSSKTGTTAASSKATTGSPTTVQWQKYVNRAWTDCAVTDLLKLTPLEAQVWLSLYNCLQEPEVRKVYHIHAHRKTVLQRVRKYINEILIDQLPMLAEVQRTLDEMAIVTPAEPTGASKAGLLLETLPVVEERLSSEAFATVKGAGFEASWKGVGSWMMRHIFVTSFKPSEFAANSDITKMADMYSDDSWMEAALGSPKCHRCGAEASKRCSKCKNVWYCSRECQVADWKDHKPLCELVAKSDNK